jgi:adenylate cyclase
MTSLTTWLLTEGRAQHSSAELLAGFSRRLVATGVPVWRLHCHVLMLHPQLRGTTLLWYADRPGVAVIERPHGSEFQDEYRLSPIAAIIDQGAPGVRERLETQAPPWRYPILGELKAQGVTDYLALPVRLTVDRLGSLTLATCRPGGFSDDDLKRIEGAMPALGVLLENLEVQRLAARLLDLYVGRDAGARILSGDIRRGTNASLTAALWYCDLRGFTALSERLAREDVVAMLNGYFEVMAEAVQSRGGEILKFIGDAMLAVFPLGEAAIDGPAAALVTALALDAARDAVAGLARLNAERSAWGQPVLYCGIGLHFGEVMYGNIGAINRQDFTVVGPAVNLLTRIEGLCKRLERPALASAAFAARCPHPLDSLGFQPVRGLAEPVEVFGVPPADEFSREQDRDGTVPSHRDPAPENRG